MYTTGLTILIVSVITGVIVLVITMRFVRRKNPPKVGRTEESKTALTEEQEQKES